MGFVQEHLAAAHRLSLMPPVAPSSCCRCRQALLEHCSVSVVQEHVLGNRDGWTVVACSGGTKRQRWQQKQPKTEPVQDCHVVGLDCVVVLVVKLLTAE